MCVNISKLSLLRKIQRTQRKSISSMKAGLGNSLTAVIPASCSWYAVGDD